MNKQIIIAGLRARPVRTTVSILAVALEVVLILIVVGLTNGIIGETAKRTAGVGAEIMVQPPNSSRFLAMTSNSMSIKIADKLRELPTVKAVAPIQVEVNTADGIEIIYGLEPESFQAVSGGFTFLKGGTFKKADDILVDERWAKSKNVDVGSPVSLLNQKFQVAGIVREGLGARLFLSLEGAKMITSQTDKVGVFYVKVKDPEQRKVALAQIAELLPGYQLQDVNDFLSQFTASNIPGLNIFLNAVVFVALCVGVLVIFLSMYTTITERTREIGILRSLGASKAFIVGLIFQESFFVCLLGVIVGVGSSLMLGRLLESVFATLIVTIEWDWIIKASLFALLSGVIGSFYPSLKAAAQDPVEALAYE